jgi:hypothetical protein
MSSINLFLATANGLSPDNPEIQQAFTEGFNHFFWETTGILLLFLLVELVLFTVLIRRTKSPKLRKRLKLARKLCTWAGILSWIITLGIVSGLIPTGL